MKPKLTVLTPAVIVATLSMPVVARDNASSQPRLAGATQPERAPKNTAPLRLLVKASDILGVEVRNYLDERLGKIEDVVVDVGPERVAGLVVGVGGVVGAGERSVIVPMSAFHHNSDKNLLYLDTTKHALKAAPNVEIGKWEEFQQQAEVTEVYRYFNASPYFSDGSAIDTALRKVPDRSGNALTPGDQGNSARDLQITTQIRKDVLGQPRLSFNGQNVKIITVNGRVTLRGTVASDSERELIQRIAETAAPNRVDNQLEVVSATTNR